MSKIISISLPDKLHEDLKKHSEISVSGVCQKALRECLATENDLAKKGAERLRKAMLDRHGSIIDMCAKAGQEWAANEASLEELESVFEEDKIDIIQDAFFGGWAAQDIPEDLLELDRDQNNDYFFAFHDAACDMWFEMKALLGRE